MNCAICGDSGDKWILYTCRKCKRKICGVHIHMYGWSGNCMATILCKPCYDDNVVFLKEIKRIVNDAEEEARVKFFGWLDDGIP